MTERIWLSVEETARVVTGAKAKGMTVHALVCGAIFVAHARQQRHQWPFACISTVDLRTRTVPPVSPTDTTNLIGFHRIVIQAGANLSAPMMGKRIGADLAHCIADRSLYVPTSSLELPFLKSVQGVEWQRLNICVNNWGIVPNFVQPPGVDWLDFRGIWPDPIKTSFSGYLVYTFNGRLSIDCHYPGGLFGRDEVKEMASEVVDELEVATR
ncbi:phthiocerol/phthiodiolone dimycocerosyl transferase family protein [Phytoactinopolyspora limicola]|uniref:phthiocerol/phthiodiolone dimycocerosyl transferase family protein n=1 Tax=Phytoactinopolyspora limicola TaxID=2715536 RepID=UPI003CCCCD5E